jgi:hypothetical protein
MRHRPFRFVSTSLMAALLAAPIGAFAASPASTRNANVWGWRDHQPTETEIQQKESAAGVTPTRSQNESASATVDQLYKQLLGTPN